jgi:hypothetical protein
MEARMLDTDSGATVRVIRLWRNNKNILQVEYTYSHDGVTWAPSLKTALEGTFYAKAKLEAQIRRAHGLGADFRLKPHYWRGLISCEMKRNAPTE